MEGMPSDEWARTTSKAIDAASGLGRFLERAFGDLIVDAAGLASDRLKYYRMERAALLAARVEERLKEYGVKNSRTVPPKIALPMLEAAAVEDDDSLHHLWAELFASAMNPAREEITVRFIDVLKAISPIEAKCLASIYKEHLLLENDELGHGAEFTPFAALDDLASADEADDVLRHFLNLGLIRSGLNFAMPATGHSDEEDGVIPVSCDVNIVAFTPFGRKLCEALNIS